MVCHNELTWCDKKLASWQRSVSSRWSGRIAASQCYLQRGKMCEIIFVRPVIEGVIHNILTRTLVFQFSHVDGEIWIYLFTFHRDTGIYLFTFSQGHWDLFLHIFTETLGFISSHLHRDTGGHTLTLHTFTGALGFSLHFSQRRRDFTLQHLISTWCPPKHMSNISVAAKTKYV